MQSVKPDAAPVLLIAGNASAGLQEAFRRVGLYFSAYPTIIAADLCDEAAMMTVPRPTKAIKCSASLGADAPLDHRTIALQPRHVAWLEQFRQRHGRRPAVLHVGNIGNNAYILARALRAAGIDSDVLSHNYYHIMACPEWEEADFVGDIGDHWYPAWAAVDLRGFQRPPWFVQAPILNCLEYLRVRRCGNPDAIQQQWQRIEALRMAICAAQRAHRQKPSWRSLVAANLRQVARSVRRFLRSTIVPAGGAEFAARVRELQHRFAEIFPERDDQLHASDLADLATQFAAWKRVLALYDIVVGYSIEGIYPLLCGRPYFALEHGTIRSIPFESDGTGRLCALTYRLADHVLITNADNDTAARRLGVSAYSFLPHPLNDAAETVPGDVGELRAALRRALDADFLVLHPSRQHWTSERHPSWEKGNDYFIEGFARFVREKCPRAGAVFVNWGKTVDASRALLANLGIARHVHWIEPQSNRRLLAYIAATDVLADQFYLGAFGGTMPKALMLGRPNLIHLDAARHRWCLPEMPPVCNVRTPEEIFVALARLASDAQYYQSIAQAGLHWYQEHHSMAVVVDRFVDRMSQVLDRRTTSAAPASDGAVHRLAG